ncbi:hypothetical protein AB0L70_15165 [Kribbella sp. NPDC051952]|uniref:hypothetical protein n=1 Tax=Kribbella sp. NPDC051952 TaxID=3154851 RepID=UPI003435665B
MMRRGLAPAWVMVLAVVLPVLAAAALFVGGLAMAIIGLANDRPVLGWCGVALLVIAVVVVGALRANSRRT